MLPQISDKTDTICNMPCHRSIFFYNNRIARADHFRCRREPVYKLRHRCLARHRHIETSHVQSTECVKCFLRLLQRNVKCQICRVNPQLCEAVILHCRRPGMSDRRADQSIKFCVSCNSLFHVSTASSVTVSHLIFVLYLFLLN